MAEVVLTPVREFERRAEVAADTIAGVAGLVGLTHKQLIALLDAGLSTDELVAMIGEGLATVFRKRPANM